MSDSSAAPVQGAPRPPIVVAPESSEGGKAFAAGVRGHRVIVDQPAHAGGDDAGPMPIELLGVALGTCVAYYVAQFCRAREIPTAGLAVEVQQHQEKQPVNRVAAFVVQVRLAATPDLRTAELLERAARTCPVGNTLARAAEIVYRFTYGG